ncbi:hypothetical protein [uncultured Litoreibacter sp.]|uniref:hypothetical protein n=1 Tax=uncultured Litoreibacter sp. TaxID=1392394 RepID=UPI002624F696|nr:hypothetical protein [uncultured Litoreibacter sp.]
MSQIDFICPPEIFGKIPAPEPAAKFLPDWFKTMPREMGMADAHGLAGLTVRACLPVADIMAQGWIIPLPYDVWTEVDPDTGWMGFKWDPEAQFDPIAAHHPGQIAADKPPFLGVQPMKFVNPWTVKLPDGWSANFLHPINHFQLPFTTFNATVDCDALDMPANVPFIWHGATPGVRLQAGTPMVQVIPFERSAQLRQADVRGETAEETARRIKTHNRKHTEVSVYAREWRRRHERDGK